MHTDLLNKNIFISERPVYSQIIIKTAKVLTGLDILTKLFPLKRKSAIRYQIRRTKQNLTASPMLLQYKSHGAIQQNRVWFYWYSYNVLYNFSKATAGDEQKPLPCCSSWQSWELHLMTI